MEPQDSIMDMVNNVEPLYNDKNALFDKWVDEGDVWGERQARREAEALVRHFVDYLGEKYSEKHIREAVDEMLEDFEEHREYELKKRVKQTTKVATKEELMMDAGDIEYAKKYEDLVQRLGIENLKNLIPASPEKVRAALQRGDKYLNTIPLRKWDAAAAGIAFPGLSLSEKVGALKHVAIWYYA